MQRYMNIFASAQYLVAVPTAICLILMSSPPRSVEIGTFVSNQIKLFYAQVCYVKIEKY